MVQSNSALLTLEQTATVFVDGLRMQRYAKVRAVQGEAAVSRFEVDGATGSNERRRIGDGIEDGVSVAVSASEKGLVEVGGSGRINRHEWQISGIDNRGVGTGRVPWTGGD